MPASTQSHRKRPRPAGPLSRLFSMPNLAIFSEIILGLALGVKAILAAAGFFRPRPGDPPEEALAGWAPTEAGAKAGGASLQASGIRKKSVAWGRKLIIFRGDRC